MSIKLGPIFQGNKKYPITRTFADHKKQNPGTDYGLDFAAPSGTGLLAPFDGKVIVARFETGGFCWRIDIKSKEDPAYNSIYAHNKSFTVKQGQEVKRGNLVAYSDNTGLSFGSHLHFTIQRNGVPVDPAKIPGFGEAEVANPVEIYQNIFITLMARWPDKYEIQSFTNSKQTPYAYAKQHLIPIRYISKTQYQQDTTKLQAEVNTLFTKLKAIEAIAASQKADLVTAAKNIQELKEMNKMPVLIPEKPAVPRVTKNDNWFSTLLKRLQQKLFK